MQVKAVEDDMAAETAPVVGATEVVEAPSIEPDKPRLGSRRS